MGTFAEGRVRTDITEDTGIKVFAIVQNPDDNDQLTLVQINPGDPPVNADAVIFEKDGAPIGAIRVSNLTTVTATYDADIGRIYADSWEPTALVLFRTNPDVYREMMSVNEFIQHDPFLSRPILDRYYGGIPLQSSILDKLQEIGGILNASNVSYIDYTNETISAQNLPQSSDLQQERSQNFIS